MPPRARKPTNPRGPQPDENNVVQLKGGPRVRKRAVGNGNPTGEKAIRALRRKAYALQLKRQGATYVKIAEMIAPDPEWGVPGYTKADAHHDVMDTLRAIIEEPAREVLAVELSRLDTALMAIWSKVLQGQLGAIDRLLKIQHQRALYQGLYSPERYVLTGPDGGPLQVESLTDPDELRAAAVAAAELIVGDARMRQEAIDAEVVSETPPAAKRAPRRRRSAIEAPTPPAT